MEKISVIIVNWNVPESLTRCLDSIRATTYPNLEIIVIDNASSRAIHPLKVKFIQNKTNIGLPRAWNQGLECATGDYILILNPDTRLPTDFFIKALDFAHRTSDLGVMGSGFVDPDGTEQGSVFPEPSVLRAIGQYWLGLGPLTEKYIPSNRKPLTVNCVSGACLFFPKSTIDKIGKFSEKAFMYYEDFDYCRRIRAAGLKVIFNPHITIIHEHGQSSKQNLQAQKYLRQSSLWYNGLLKHYLLWFIIWSSQKFQKLIGAKR